MVEIIPKPVEKTPLEQVVLFYFSILLLIGVIIGYFILGRLEKNSETYLNSLEDKVYQIRISEIISLEKEVKDYERKINDFALIFARHNLNSSFFEFLERKTYSRIFFQKINLKPQELKVSLLGQADSFLSLGYQVQIFEREDLIKKTNLSKVSIGKEGQIEFILDLVLDPEMVDPLRIKESEPLRIEEFETIEEVED